MAERIPQTWRSHKLLSGFLRERFGTTLASEVMWVDVHTGLGSRRELQYRSYSLLHITLCGTRESVV
jgi:hypothetical protein